MNKASEKTMKQMNFSHEPRGEEWGRATFEEVQNIHFLLNVSILNL